MIRPLALALALVSLAACDANGPTDSADDLLGTWTLRSVSSQQVATSSSAQTIVDLNRPPSGAIQLGETESGSLSYLSGYYRWDQTSSLYLTSYDPYSGQYPAFRHTMEIREDGSSAYVSLTSDGETDGGYVYRQYSLETQGQRMRSGATYTLDARLNGYDLSAQASAKGSFTLGHWSIQANTPTAVSSYDYEFPAGNTVRYGFEPGGVLKVYEVVGNRTTTRVGTWSRTGDRITVGLAEDGVSTTFEYKAVRTGGSLEFIVDQEAYPCDRECLRNAEAQFGMDSGTLTSLKTVEILRLSSSPSSSKQEAASGVGLPAPLASRVRVAPMSR